MKFSKIIITTSVGFAILIIMAAIGVFSLKNVVSVQLHPQKSELIQRAEKIADFSKILNTYTVTKALNVIGVTAVVAEHPKTGQYMAIIDPGWAMNISKNDIQTGRLHQKLTDYASKISSPGIKLNKLEIMPKGNFNAFNQSIPYAQIKVKISGLSSETTYDGMIGIVVNPETSKSELIVSLNKNGTFKQKIAENFFKDVKLQ
ncbi:MAG: hypothetical protein WCG23_01760 [bacterium]